MVARLRVSQPPPAAPEVLRIEGRRVPIAFQRNPLARRIVLRLDEWHETVLVTLPRGVKREDGLAFARRHDRWLLKRLMALPPRVHFADGVRIPYLGVEHRVCHQPHARRAVWREEGAIYVSGQVEHMARRLTDWLIQEARAEIAPRAHAMAEQVERKISRITVRDTRSRWGSCSHDGRLSFCWRLVMAPPDVLEYVVAHEVAHLVYLNHGKRFWKLVERFASHSARARDWLRVQGPRLHRYG